MFKSSEKTIRDFVESFNVSSNNFRLVEFRFVPKHVMMITITCQNKVIVVLMGRGFYVESIKLPDMYFEGTGPELYHGELVCIDILEQISGVCLSNRAENVVVRDEGSCFVVSFEL